MEGSELTGKPVNEQCRNIEQKHVEEIGISKLFMETRPLARQKHTYSKDQSRHSGANMKS
jgi:hypothetical protein